MKAFIFLVQGIFLILYCLFDCSDYIMCDGGTAALVAASLIGNAMNAGVNANLNSVNRMFQHSENKLSRDWQESMYNKYYSPSAIVRQQQQAGINPFVTDMAGGVSMPTSSQTPSPNSHSIDFGIGDSVHTYGQLSSIEAQNSSYRAQSLKSLVDGAVQIAKEVGPSAANSYFQQFLPTLDLDGQSNAQRMFDTHMQGMQVQNMRNDLEYQLRSKFGTREVTSALDMIDQQIIESVARIGKMASDAKLNESNMSVNSAKVSELYASAYELGARAAKDLADKGYSEMLTKQGSTLLPYMESQFILQNGLQGMDFLSNKAYFIGQSKVRDLQSTDFYQKSQVATHMSNPDNNPIFGFMRGFTQSANINIGLNRSFNTSNSTYRGSVNSYYQGFTTNKNYNAHYQYPAGGHP